MRSSSSLLLVPALFASAAFSLRAADLRSATVTQTYNEVKVIAPNRADEPAASGITIAGERGVRTGAQSRAELEFQDRTLTRLGANTIFSFEGGTREMEMQQGTMLLQVPKNAGGAKIRTAAVTAAITGTTILLEYTPDMEVIENGVKKKKKGKIKVIVLEGTLKLSLNNGSGQTVTLGAGQMLVTDPNTVQLPGAVTVDLERVATTSLLVNNAFWGSSGITGRSGAPLERDPQGRPAGRLSMALIDPEIDRQRELILNGTLVPVNPGLIALGTEVLRAGTDLLSQLDTRFTVEQLTPPEPTPPPMPTPPKFGSAAPVNAGNLTIDAATTIQTDPIITSGAQQVLGTLYRGVAQDGPAAAYFFGSTSAFDTTFGLGGAFFDSFGRPAGFPAGNVAAFRVSGTITLAGNPSFLTTGGARDVALIGDTGIGSTGSFGFNLAALRSLLLGSTAGSVNLGAGATFTGTASSLALYARGSGNNVNFAGSASLGGDFYAGAEGDALIGGNVLAGGFRALGGRDVVLSGTVNAPSIQLTATRNAQFGGANFTLSALTSLQVNAALVRITSNLALGAGTTGALNSTGGIDAAGFSLSGLALDLALGSGNLTAQFVNVRSITGGAASSITAPGGLTVGSLALGGPINAPTIRIGSSFSTGTLTSNSLVLTGTGANFTATGNVTLDQLSVPGSITIGGFLRTSGVLAANLRTVGAGGDITITGDAGNPAAFPGSRYASFTSSGGSIAVGPAVNGLTLYADTISAAGSVRAGGFISDSITAGAGGIAATTSSLNTGTVSTSGAVSVANDLYFNSGAPAAYTLASGSLAVGRNLQFDSARTLSINTGAASVGGRFIGFVNPGQNGGSLTFNAASLNLTAPGSGDLINFSGGNAAGVGTNGGAGGMFTLTLTSASTFTLPGSVVLNGGTASGTGRGGAGGAFTLTTAGAAILAGPIRVSSGAATLTGSGGTVSVTAAGDLTLNALIETRSGANFAAVGSNVDGSSTLVSSTGAIRLNSALNTGLLSITAGTDIVLQAGANLFSTDALTLNAGRDFLGQGGSLNSLSPDLNVTTGRDLTTGFFGANSFNIGRNATLTGNFSFVNASIGGALTAGGMTAFANPANTGNAFTLTAGSVTVSGNVFFPSPNPTDPTRTLTISTIGALTINGGFLLGSVAGPSGGAGGTLTIATATNVTLGNPATFYDFSGGNATDPAGSGGNGGSLLIDASGNVTLLAPVTARGGGSQFGGTGSGGVGGTVRITAASITTDAITTLGGADGAGNLASGGPITLRTTSGDLAVRGLLDSPNLTLDSARDLIFTDGAVIGGASLDTFFGSTFTAARDVTSTGDLSAFTLSTGRDVTVTNTFSAVNLTAGRDVTVGGSFSFNSAQVGGNVSAGNLGPAVVNLIGPPGLVGLDPRSPTDVHTLRLGGTLTVTGGLGFGTGPAFASTDTAIAPMKLAIISTTGQSIALDGGADFRGSVTAGTGQTTFGGALEINVPGSGGVAGPVTLGSSFVFTATGGDSTMSDAIAGGAGGTFRLFAAGSLALGSGTGGNVIDVRGGNADAVASGLGAGGNGGFVEVVTTGNLTLGQGIAASTGINGANLAAAAGTGGSVALDAGGTLTVASGTVIGVSAADELPAPSPAPIAQATSLNGGKVTLIARGNPAAAPALVFDGVIQAGISPTAHAQGGVAGTVTLSAPNGGIRLGGGFIHNPFGTINISSPNGTLSLGATSIFGGQTNLSGLAIVLDSSALTPSGPTSFVAGAGGIDSAVTLGDSDVPQETTILSIGSVSVGGGIFAGSIMTTGPLSDLRADGSIFAAGGSISSARDLISANGSIALGEFPPGTFGSITAGRDISAPVGIFTPGPPSFVTAGRDIVAGAILTGTLTAGGDIIINNVGEGFGIIANSIIAPGALRLNEAPTLEPNTLRPSAGGGFTPDPFVLNVGAIISTGATRAAIFATGSAADTLTPNPGNGGSVTLTIGGGLNIAFTSGDLASIYAHGGEALAAGTLGGSGGNVSITTGGDFTLASGSLINATSATIPNGGANALGNGGSVGITTAGLLSVSGQILTSGDDDPMLGLAFRTTSRTGGSIALTSTRTGGTGINLGTAELRADVLTGSPVGSITLTTSGANVDLSAALVSARGGGSISINAPNATVTLGGGTLQAGTLNLNLGAGGLFTGTGSIVADLANSAALRPAIGTGSTGLAVTGNLSLLSGSRLQFQLGGLTQGSQYGFLSVNGSVALGGQLVVSFANGFQSAVSGSNTFTLVSTTVGFSGAFANVASGGRLTTSDGFGSFLVNYAGGALTLSSFLPPGAVVGAVFVAAGGNWSSPANWTSNPNFPNNGQPGPGNLYDATIANGGTATLDVPITIQNLTLSSGVISGANLLTVLQTFQWSGGSISGGASVTTNGGIVFSGGGVKDIFGGTLTNAAGSTAVDGAASTGPVRMDFGGVLNNAGTFLAQNDVGIAYTGTSTLPSVNNSGTFTRNVSSGAYVISAPFNNSGTVNGQTGTLSLLQGGAQTGLFNVSAGAVVGLDLGTFTIATGATTSGAGTLRWGGGNVNVNNSVNFAGLQLQLGGSVVTIAGAQTLNQSGSVNFMAGVLQGGGVLSVSGGLTFSGGGVKDIFGGTLTNAAGSTAVDGAASTGPIRMDFGGVLNNAGTFQAQNDVGIAYTGNSTLPSVNNSGTFTRNVSSGTYVISAPFNNSGTVNGQTGTLSLLQGGAQTGLFNVSAGAVVGLDLGTFTIATGATASGAGTLRWGGGNVNVNNSVNFAGLQLQLGGSVVTIAGGQTLNQSGSVNFTAGVLQGAGVLSVSGGLTFSGGGVKDIFGGTLTNAAGSTAVDGAASTGPIRMDFGGVLNNAGTFQAQNDVGIAYTATSTLPSVNNSGTFTRNVSSGAYVISAPFNNSGTVNGQTGTLSLLQGGTQTGLFNVSAGAVVGFDLGTFTIATGATTSGAGTLRWGGGNVNVNNSVNFAGVQLQLGGSVVTIAGGQTLNQSGSVNFTAGVLQGAGVLSVSGGLTFSGGGVKDIFGGRLTNAAGSTAVDGAASTGPIRMDFGGVLNNAGTFQAQNDVGIAYTGNSTLPSVNNSGTFTRSVGSGTYGIDAVFNNSGTVSGQTGTLSLRQGGTQTGLFNVSAGAVVGLDLGTFTIATGATASGAGTLRWGGGNVNVNNSVNFAGLQLQLGGSVVTIAGGQTLNQSGSVNFTAGVLQGAGVLSVSGGLTFSGGGVKDIFGGTLTNAAGSTAVDGAASTGPIRMLNGGVLNNAGSFLAQNDLGVRYAGGATPNLNNSGTFTRNTGAGTYNLEAQFNNSGTVNASSGTIGFSAGYTQTAGTLNLNGGGVSGFLLDLQGGLLTGTGDINAGIQSAAQIRPLIGAGSTGLAVGASVSLLAGSQLQFQLGGLTQGSQYGFIGVNGAVALAGNLVLSFANGFQSTVSGTDSFTLLTSTGPLSGSFLNIASGSRLTTTDGFGSFLVSYSGSSVVLSNFQLPGGLTAVWDGSSNVWSSGANWSTNPTFPNGAINVSILGGTVVLDGNFSVLALNLGGGAINSAPGAQTLTVNQLFTWTGGTLAGPNVTANGGLLMNAIGTLELNGTVLTLPAGQTATDSAPHTFTIGNGGRFVNNGTFLARSSTGIANNINGAFTNNGIFTRDIGSSTGTGTYLVATSFDNASTGTLNQLSHILAFSGAFSSQGAINVAPGTTLQFAGTATSTGTFTLDGFLEVSGSLNAASIRGTSGNVTLLGSGTLNLPGGFDYRGSSGAAPTAGGFLAVSGPSLIFGNAAGQLNGAQLSGGDATSGAGASGGSLVASAASGDLVVDTARLTVTTGANLGVPSGGAGGTVSLGATNGQVIVRNVIEVSSNIAGRASASGGLIQLQSGRTTGAAITLTNSASLIAGVAAGGPGGSISLTSAGGTIDLGGASLGAGGGSIFIDNPLGNVRFNGAALTTDAFIFRGLSLTLDAGLTTFSFGSTDFIIGAGGVTNAGTGGSLTLGSGALPSTGAINLTGFGSNLTAGPVTAPSIDVAGTLTSSGRVRTTSGALNAGNVSAGMVQTAGSITTGNLTANAISALGPITVSATNGLSTSSLSTGALLTLNGASVNPFNLVDGKPAAITLTFDSYAGAATVYNLFGRANGADPNANGSGGSLTLNQTSTALFTLGAVNLAAAPTSLAPTGGSNGGLLTVITPGAFTLNANVNALSGQIPAGGPDFFGNGGRVSITAGGALRLEQPIFVSAAQPNSGAHFQSATGGVVQLTSSATTGEAIFLGADLGAALSSGAILAGGTRPEFTVRSAGGSIGLNGSTFDVTGGLVDFGFTGGTPGAINFGTVGLTRIFANDLIFSAESLSLNNVALNITNRADFIIGAGGITGNTSLAVIGGGVLFLAPSAGSIILGNGAGISVAGPLQAASIRADGVSAPSIATTTGNFTTTGGLRTDAINVAGTFDIQSGFNALDPFSPRNVHGTPALVTVTAGTYLAPALQYNLNGVVAADPDFAGDGGSLSITTLNASATLRLGSTITNVNLSGAPTSATPVNGSNGGTLTVNAAGDFNLQGPIVATTGLIPAAGPGEFGTGGSVRITAGGSILFSGFNPSITVSSADSAAGSPHTTSRFPGLIRLESLLTTGTAIDVGGLNAPLAPESFSIGDPGGDVRLISAGGDVILRGANVRFGTLVLTIAGTTGVASLPSGNAVTARDFQITAPRLVLSTFVPVVQEIATFTIGVGGISAPGFGGLNVAGGGDLRVTSIGNVVSNGATIFSLQVTGATSGINSAGGPILVTGDRLTAGSGGIAGDRIRILGDNSVLSTSGNLTTSPGQGVVADGLNSSVNVTGSYTGGSLLAASVSIGGSVAIDTGFAQPHGIQANTINVGGTISGANVTFYGPLNAVGGTPVPFTLNAVGFLFQSTFLFPELRANGVDSIITGSDPGSGGSLNVTLSGLAGLTLGGAAPELLGISARGGDVGVSPTSGGNGGSLTLNLPNGPLTVFPGASIFASTGLLTVGSPAFFGAGGSVSVIAPTLQIDGLITVSSNELPNSTGYRASVSGGSISLRSTATATAGPGISIGSTAQLVADRATGSGGPGGSITVTANGTDIFLDTASFVSASGGSVTIQTYEVGNPATGTLNFGSSSGTPVDNAAAVTYRAGHIIFSGDSFTHPDAASLTLVAGSGGFESNMSGFTTSGNAPFNATSAGDVSVAGDFGVRAFNSTSTLTLGLGNLAVSGLLRFGSITSAGGSVNAQAIETFSFTGSVIEANGGALRADNLTATLPTVTNGTYSFLTPGVSHTWNVSAALRGSGSVADLLFRGRDGNGGTPNGANGESLTLFTPSLIVDDPGSTQGLGGIDFDGGAAFTPSAAPGDGGSLVATVVDFSVAPGRRVTATSGLIPDGGPSTAGLGGSVDVTASNAIDIAGLVEVSSDDTPGPSPAPPSRRSNQGGSIKLTSTRSSAAAPVTAIRIASTGQLNALLNSAATGPGGKVTIVATGANSKIQMDGRARADRGTVEIRHTGPGGQISTSASTDIRGDIVKIGALGNNGILTIAGGTFNANTTLQLYATGSNGQVQFTGNTFLQGNSLKFIAGQTVTINNGVQVNVTGGSSPVSVFTNVPNYTGSGGNGSTSGVFTGNGATTQPLGAQPGF